MFPYYYPTTLVMLDDDSMFLESFSLRFLDEPVVRTFTDPNDTIHQIFAAQAGLPALAEYLSPHDSEIAPSPSAGHDRLLKLKGRQLPALMRLPQRFAQVSVLVVDFDMPVMNGLQVCRALLNHPVRKILLTGKAGVETGINALNEGLIDAYYAKQDRNLTQLLKDAIPRQRHAFFTEITRPLRGALALDELAFLNDPVFEDAFTAIAKAAGAVEHYASVEPPGMTLVTSDGSVLQLLVSDEAGLAAQADLAQDAGAPDDLVALLSEQRVLGVFPRAGFYSPDHVTDWRQHIIPARRVDGSRAWFYGLAPRAAPLSEGIVAFDTFLRQAS